MKLQNKKDYRNAVEILNKAAYAYYTLDNPIMTDSDYDKLYFQVVDYEKENGFDIDSPTQRVGDQILDGFEKAKHIEKMYSLNDVFNENGFLEWTAGIKKDYPNAIFYQEPKYDGLSLNLLYKKGILISAITRGNGEVGEDVTANAKYILGIPMNIEYKGILEIRGEVVIFKKDFEKINQWRIDQGKNAFSNERNAASGSLRSFESESVKNSRLRFTPYGLGFSDIEFEKQSESYKWILSQGFVNWNPKIDLISNSLTPEDLIYSYERIINNRGDYPMLLDGMVVKVDQKDIQEDLGFTSKFPKWAIAFKFPAQEKHTKLVDVIAQVGKTGAITPVGIVSPVEFEGVTVNRVTLHNYQEIERMNLHTGDIVSIIRSGDVIPKILGVDFTKRNENNIHVIEEPSICPICESTTEYRQTANGEETAVLYCSNYNCPAVLKGRLEYAAGKKALDIPGFGEAVVNELINKGFVNSLSDIFELTKEELLTLEGFAKRKAEITIEAIKNVQNKPLEAHRLLNAIDIPTIGESASKKLVNEFKHKVFTGELSYEELIQVQDIGDTSANAYVDFFSKENNKIEVDKLLDLINLKFPEEIIIPEGSTIINKKFVITGTLSKSRGHFKDLIEKNGGKVTGSVSKNTDYLLAGEEAGSKLEKAEKLGVEILNENQFLELLN